MLLRELIIMFTLNNFIKSIKNTVSSTICFNHHRLMPEDLIDETINSNETITSNETINSNKTHIFNNNQALIYIRVSTIEQDIGAQKFSCEQFCNQHKLEIKKIYIEKCSAFKSKSQPELYKLLNENSNCNLIIFSIDRLSRNIQIGNELLKKMENKNITLISVKENINLSTALGKHNFRNYINAAQYESELISERVKNNIKYKRANNLHIGKAPYGYQIENQKLIKNIEEYSVINFIINNFGKKKSSDALTHNLFQLLTKLNRDQSEFVPIVFTLEDENYEYHSYNVNEKLKVTSRMLANILNDYNIKKRNTIWNLKKISQIVKNFPIYEFNHLNISKISKCHNISPKRKY